MPPSRPIRLLLPALAAVAALSACAGPTHRMIAERDYPPNPDIEAVRLFVGEVIDPHVRIAWVNSYPSEEKTAAEKRRQLEDLRARAAELGADAIMDVMLLKERRRGYVPDPAVPFTAWEQGERNLWFLRGVAIRYENPEGATPLEWEERQAGLTEADKTPQSPAVINVDEIPEVESKGRLRGPAERTPIYERTGAY